MSLGCVDFSDVQDYDNVALIVFRCECIGFDGDDYDDYDLTGLIDIRIRSNAAEAAKSRYA